MNSSSLFIMPKQAVQSYLTAWKLAQKNWIIRYASLACLVFQALMIGIIAIYWRLLPPVIPLWYSKPWGLDRLAPTAYILLIPSIAAVWYFIDTVIVEKCTSSMLVFSQIMYVSAFVVHALCFLAVVSIVQIVA